MAIAPVSMVSVCKNNPIGFEGRRNRNNDDYIPQSREVTGLRKVPVIVLMAMSPLNSASVEPYNPNYIPNQIEAVQQNESKMILKRELHSGNESIRYMALSDDGNDKNFEIFGFNYDNKVGNKRWFLVGQVIGVCDTPREDGRYLMAYRLINNGKTDDEFSLCYVPDVFGAYLNSYAKGWANNNALMSVPRSEFEEYFGKNNVKNAPLIKEQVTYSKPIK